MPITVAGDGRRRLADVEVKATAVVNGVDGLQPLEMVDVSSAGFSARIRAAGPSTADDVSIIFDGRRLDNV